MLDPAVTVRPLRSALLTRKRYLPAVSILQSRYDAPPAGSVDAWRAAGFEVVGHRHDLLAPRDPAGRRLGPKDRPLAVPHPVVVPSRERLEVAEGLPRLRWVIDLASPGGPKGESWGDTHFARSLASALERQGQHVAVDSRDVRHRPSRDHDDVLLVLRGLDRVDPRPALVNLEWIISHPDLVAPEEIAAYDAVFAASHSWSTETSKRLGVRVESLLQCTDPTLFGPRAPADDGPEVLFVGNSRGVFRSAVRTAISAGVTPTIYGAAWDAFVDPALVAAKYVANARLAALYGSAGVVLNDHWEDMRRDGFLSNRLFDAAACGARIVSDDVPDLDDLFGGLVQVFHDEADMRRLVEDRDTVFPGAEERRAIAERVALEHSFDARARTLAECAARLHRGRS